MTPIIFARINDTRGFTVLATAPCRVVVSDAEAGYTHEKDATVVSDERIWEARAQADEADQVDVNFVADWIYAGELTGSQMYDLFRKRGCSTTVICEEDNCGDDTAEYFRDRVAVGDEVIEVTTDGWRIYRSEEDIEGEDEECEGMTMAKPKTKRGNASTESTDKFSKSPYLIGYWARMHGLTVGDINSNDVLYKIIRANEYSNVRFNEGWDQAEENLKKEKMEKLMASLREAHEAYEEQH